MITGVHKVKQRESLSDALATAAIAVAKAFSPPPAEETEKSSKLSENCSPIHSFSPSKKLNLRMKNLEQLRQLQQLKEGGILSAEEYQSQKKIVLMSLNNLV